SAPTSWSRPRPPAWAGAYRASRAGGSRRRGTRRGPPAWPSASSCSSSCAARPPTRWTARGSGWPTTSAGPPQSPRSPSWAPSVADLTELLRPVMTVAIGDGAGMPQGEVLTELSAVAARVGGVRLLLGWCLREPAGLDFAAFADVATTMGGYGLRKAIDAGAVRYLPVRYGALPALLHDVIRPDLLIAPVTARPGGYRFTTEVAWLRAAVAAGATVAAVVRPGPCCDAGPPLPAERVVPLDIPAGDPVEMTWPEPSDVQQAIAERIAGLVPAGARLQSAPGGIGTALLRVLDRP